MNQGVFVVAAKTEPLVANPPAPRGSEPAPALPRAHRYGTAFLTALVLGPALGWVVSTEAGIIAASREFLVATIAAFMAAAASPPRQERLLYRHLLPAIPLVFLTVLAVAAFRAVWLGDLAWHTHFAALAPASAWTVGLVTLVYWGAARASIDATARAKRRSAIPHPPATLAERFTVTLWWCISTVVCVWAPTLALFQVFEYGFGWQGQHENLITFLLVGVSTSLVFTLGMMGILPGSNRRID